MVLSSKTLSGIFDKQHLKMSDHLPFKEEIFFHSLTAVFDFFSVLVTFFTITIF